MTPARTASRLRSIADRIAASTSPSASAVASAIKQVLASVVASVVPVVVKDSGGTTWGVANPGDHEWMRQLWALQFGATGTEHVLAWANSADDALGEAADYLAETGKKGYFVPDDIMAQHYEEAKAELGPDADDDAVHQKAEADLTYTEAGYIPSHEWWVDEASPELTKLAKAASAAWDPQGGQEG